MYIFGSQCRQSSQGLGSPAAETSAIHHVLEFVWVFVFCFFITIYSIISAVVDFFFNQ